MLSARQQIAAFTKFVIGNESVPYNWHDAGSLGWPFPMLKYKYIFQLKYTEAILSNSTRKLLYVLFSIIFGTLLFRIPGGLGARVQSAKIRAEVHFCQVALTVSHCYLHVRFCSSIFLWFIVVAASLAESG